MGKNVQKRPPIGEIRWNPKKKRLRPPQVSSFGRYRTSRGKVVRPKPSSDGRAVVNVCGLNHYFYQLVCRAFHGRPPSSKHRTTNHKDLDTTNNRAENLEWMTHKEQNRHSYANNTSRKPHRAAISILSRAVGSNGKWKAYPSLSDAAQTLHVRPGNISHCLSGVSKQTGGYEFKRQDTPYLVGEVWKDVVLGDSTGDRTQGEVPTFASQLVPRVSSLGRFQDQRGRISTPVPSTSGYVQVGINNTLFSLHALILRAFQGKAPSNQHNVDHIDGNPRNNKAANLRWLTHTEQIRHSYASNSQRGEHVTQQFIPCWSRKYGTSDAWQQHASKRAAALAIGCDYGYVNQCVLGKLKHYAGYEFCYREDPDAEPDTLLGEVWKDVVVATSLKINV